MAGYGKTDVVADFYLNFRAFIVPFKCMAINFSNANIKYLFKYKYNYI